jgi:hypothetical protein
VQLTINDQPQKFISLQQFCRQWDLPDDFGMNFFEPKSWAGLGSIKGAGEAMMVMKDEVIDSIPEPIPIAGLFSVVDIVSQSFRYQLEMANQEIGLRLHDVGFAVAGFEDVMRDVVYQLMRLNHTYQGDLDQARQNFDFWSGYQSWLDTSVRVSSEVHVYQHAENTFDVRIVNHIYGRVGLEVRVDSIIYFVTDKSLACPGENFMEDLCREVTERICERLIP